MNEFLTLLSQLPHQIIFISVLLIVIMAMPFEIVFEDHDETEI